VETILAMAERAKATAPEGSATGIGAAPRAPTPMGMDVSALGGVAPRASTKMGAAADDNVAGLGLQGLVQAMASATGRDASSLLAPAVEEFLASVQLADAVTAATIPIPAAESPKPSKAAVPGHGVEPTAAVPVAEYEEQPSSSGAGEVLAPQMRVAEARAYAAVTDVAPAAPVEPEVQAAAPAPAPVVAVAVAEHSMVPRLQTVSAQPLNGSGSALALRSSLASLSAFCDECDAVVARAAGDGAALALARDGVPRVLAVGLGVHRTSSSAQERGMAALCALAVDAEGEARVAAAGAAECCAAAMRLHPHSPSVCAAAAALLACFAFDAVAASHATITGALELLAAAAAQHGASSAACAEHCCAAVAALAAAGVEDVTRRLRASGILARLVSLLRSGAHPGCPAVVTQACGALMNLASDDAGEAAVVAAGGIDGVLAALKAYPRDIDCAEAATECLANLTMSADNKARAVAAGVPAAVITAAALHCKTNSAVAAQCCRVLAHTAHGATPAVKARIVALGATEAVSTALAAHPRSAAVAESAAALCAALAQGGDAAGALLPMRASLIAALNGHRGAVRVCTSCCAALSAMAAGGAAATRAVAASGAAEAVLNAARQHPRSAPVQAAALATLAAVCDENLPPEEIRQVAGGGGVTLAVQAMNSHGGSEDVCASGAAVIAVCCAAVPEMVARAVALRAPDALVAALKAFGGSTASGRVVCPAADAIAALAGASDEACAACVTAGALEAVGQAMWADHSGAAIAGCSRALANLVTQPGAEARLLGRSNSVLQALIVALTKHLSDAEVQACGCTALSAMCAEPGCGIAAIQAGGIEAVVAALRAHSTRPDVQRAASAALWRLAFDTADVVQAWEHAAGAPGGLPALWTALRIHGATLTPAQLAMGSATAARRGATAVVRSAGAHVDARMLQAALHGTIADFVAALLAHAQNLLQNSSSKLKEKLNAAMKNIPLPTSEGAGEVDMRDASKRQDR